MQCIRSTSASEYITFFLKKTDPSFVIRPPFQLQQLGGDFILNCTPSDNTSEIGWLRNDDEIINNDRISYSPNDRLRHILIISNASSADAANYTCALNRSGTLINRLISKVDIFKGMYVIMYVCMYVCGMYMHMCMIVLIVKFI